MHVCIENALVTQKELISSSITQLYFCKTDIGVSCIIHCAILHHIMKPIVTVQTINTRAWS